MGTLRLWVKITLFFSAYSPLFVILILRNFSQNGFHASLLYWPKYVITYLLISIIFVSNGILMYLIKLAKKSNNPKHITVKKKDNMNYIYLEYLVVYIIPFLFFKYSDIWSLLSFVFLIGVVCFIYVSSDLLYANIMLNLFGYRLFKVLDANDNEYMLITKNEVILDKIIDIKPINGKFVIEIGGE